MITFRFPEERQYMELLSKELNHTLAKQVLEGRDITSPQEAIEISEFFWAAVDQSIILEKTNNLNQFPEGAEYWNEKIMTSIAGYLERTGYEDQWDLVLDKQ